MKPIKKLGTRDLIVGGRYLHINGAWVREILSIEGHAVHYRDEFGTGTCSKSAFLQRWPSLASETNPDRTVLPRKAPNDTEFTLRDEANALVAFAFRNGFIEELHAGKASPLLEQPELSRITDDEMRRLMIEASEKVAQMLRLKNTDPKKYDALVRRYHDRYCRGWRRSCPRFGLQNLLIELRPFEVEGLTIHFHA